MARANVPQLGKWESEDNVPQENPDMFPARPPSRASVESEESKEDSGEYRHSAASAHGNIVRTRSLRMKHVAASIDIPLLQSDSKSDPTLGSARPSRPPTVGSDCSIDRSQLYSSMCLEVIGSGTNPVFEDYPMSSCTFNSHQSNRDAKAKRGCFPFCCFKKKET